METGYEEGPDIGLNILVAYWNGASNFYCSWGNRHVA